MEEIPDDDWERSEEELQEHVRLVANAFTRLMEADDINMVMEELKSEYGMDTIQEAINACRESIHTTKFDVIHAANLLAMHATDMHGHSAEAIEYLTSEIIRADLDMSMMDLDDDEFDFMLSAEVIALASENIRVSIRILDMR